MDAHGEILRLRTALRDLVALFMIPAAWVGRDPPAIAAGLADVLVGLLQLEFAFVRLRDPDGAAAVDVTRGKAWKAFPEWLQGHLTTDGRLSRKEVIPDIGEAGPYRGVVIPIGVNGEGGLVAAACDRSDFPADTEDLLLHLAANHAGTAFQSARLIHERKRAEDKLREARGELEMKVAERTAELRRSEAYLAEAQRLTHTGSYALNVATGEYTHSSDEHSRLFGFDPEKGVPSFEEILQRVHPEDRARCSDALERGFRERASFELEFRAVPPEGPPRYIRALAHPVVTASGELAEFVGTAIDVTERKRAEEERQAQLWFFESMDRINRAIQGTNDLRQMMGDVLDVVLAIFRCDRAWLVYPCDLPDVASHRVRMERTRPEYVGAFGLGVEIPNDPEVASVFRSVLASSGPVRFDPESGCALPSAPARRFSITSMIAMAVYPKVDRPHIFGLQQCSYPRVWTAQEERLFQAVGRRLADALDTLLMFRNLRESERKLEEAQRIAHVGYWDRDLDTDRITWSDETCRILGLPLRDSTITFAEAQERVHTEDRPIMAKAAAVALGGGARYNVEYRVVRPNGEVRVVHSQGDVMRDDSGRPRRMFGTVQDITERKRAEQALEDLAGRLIHAQEEERSRIGRELHDHVSQRLGLLTIQIDQLRAGSAIAPTIARALDDLRQGAGNIADDVHRLSHRLHSSTLDYLGLAPALQSLVGEFSARCGITIEFTQALLPTPLPPDVALCLFRITEESLTNIAKHSHARSARVHVHGAADGIHLTVEDDGEGFDARELERKAGLGFVSMQERLRALGGTVRVDSAPSRGTRIEISVPSMSVVSAPVEPEVPAGSNRPSP